MLKNLVPGGGLIPPDFPRMNAPAVHVDGLSWYSLHDAPYGISKMHFDARDETVALRYPNPDDPNLIGVPRTLAGIGHQTHDKRAVGEFTFTAKFTSELRPEQRPFLNACYKMLENEWGGIGEAPTGFGKCHGKGTPILMADGSTKAVETIVKGDRLAAPNGGYRTVLSTAKGDGPLYRVTSKSGTWTCNDEHLLSLKVSGSQPLKVPGWGLSMHGDSVTLRAIDLFNGSKELKHRLKQYRPDFVEFTPQEKLHVPPYILGLWLGDGSLGLPALTKPEGVVSKAWQAYGHKLGCYTRQYSHGARCPTWHLATPMGQSNPVITALRASGVLHHKHIPTSYRTASVEDRLSLLAGLLDTDGHYFKTTWEITQKSTSLADDIEFLAKSVGIRVSRSVKRVKLGGWETPRDYHRLILSGNTHVLPTRSVSTNMRLQKKNPLVESITIYYEGTGPFYGFELDGDRLYCLGDFTVTHNTVCGSALITAIGRPTCVVVPKSDLDWAPELLKHTDIPENKIDTWSGKKLPDPGAWVVVASLQSIYRANTYPAEVYRRFACVMFDECFHPDHDLWVKGEGWVPVSQVTTKDMVLSADPHTGTLTYEIPERVIEKEVNGPLYGLKGHSFETLTTGGHEQPILRKRKGGLWVQDRVTVADLCPNSRVKLPVSGRVPDSNPLTPDQRLAIAFEADGCLAYPPTGYHRFMFRKGRKIERMRVSLKDAGMAHKETVNGRGDTCFTFYRTPAFTKTFEWFDPTLSFQASKGFLDELVEWDGWRSATASFWETTNKPSADLAQMAAHATGHQASITIVKGRYRVRWSVRDTWVQATGVSKNKVPYAGKVHCVTVHSGNVVTRYNGTICISGNCHRLGAPEFSAAIRMFPAMFRLGLSATADRRDGKMDLIHSHVGWRHVVGQTDAAQPDYYVIPSDWTEPFDRDGKRMQFDPARTGVAKKRLMSDAVRNAAIAAATYRAHKAGRRIIVFVEQKVHGDRMETALKSMGVPGHSIIQYNGETTSVNRLRAKNIQPGMVLIATYKFTAEGTNIPPLDCAIIAHPIYDPRQAVGRITRKLEGKPKPIVLDVWDKGSGSLMAMAKARWEYLRKIGATWKGEFR